MKPRKNSPTYQLSLAQEHALELVMLDNIEKQNEIENEKWIESEIRIERELQIQRKKLEEQAKRVEEERRRIQEEFEKEQKRIAEAEERMQRILDEENERQLDLENRIQNFMDGTGDVPPELLVNADTNPGKEPCPFFVKTSACRFGYKCIRNHSRPRLSRILLLPAFFANFHLEQSQPTEHGSDLILEQDDFDLDRHFTDFFQDVVPEFENIGSIKNFIVCSNSDPYLRGHVFVEYFSER